MQAEGLEGISFKFCSCRKLENKNPRIQTGPSSLRALRDHAKVFPSAGQRLNIVGFSERLVEDLMLYRTEEGELKGGLSLFNICFRLTQLPDHFCDRLKTYKTAMVTTRRPGKEWKGIWRTGLVSGNLTIFRICWKATFYMLFSSILQYPQFCKQTTLLGSISYFAKDLTVSQGGDLACWVVEMTESRKISIF